MSPAVHAVPVSDRSFAARAPLATRKRAVVLFAGGGGSSIAVQRATGRPVDAALNHWPLALSVHQRNHPEAEHHCADVMETDPRDVLPGEPIGLLWLSPDCRHFSPAKGSAPVSKSIRALAWSAIPWAKLRRPDVIILENVEAFQTWCPVIIGPDGRSRPDPERTGETFRRWVRRLEQAGYAVEWKILNAADFGAATSRRRLFLVARRDGKPIRWPEPTHAPRKAAPSKGLKPHRAAAEVIDFSRPCPSIFMSAEEARASGLKIKRPLEEATLRRIAKGLLRYTIAAADPFIVGVTHVGDDRVRDIREPLGTVTGANRGEFALVAPIVAQGNFDRPGRDAREPLTTIVGRGTQQQLVTAHLSRQFGRSVGSDLDEPIGTVTSGGTGKSALVAAFMEQANTGMVGHDCREPVSTMVGKGCTQRLVTAQLTQFRGSNDGNGGDLGEPLVSPTAQGGHAALLQSVLEQDLDLARPFAREGEVRAFLTKYFGTASAEDVADPLATVTSRSRFGLVLVQGRAWRIVDIGMRMLDPETELAAAMGADRGYVLGFDASGRRVSKTAITKMVGNMVHPDPAEALIAVNNPFQDEPEELAA